MIEIGIPKSDVRNRKITHHTLTFNFGGMPFNVLLWCVMSAFFPDAFFALYAMKL